MHLGENVEKLVKQQQYEVLLRASFHFSLRLSSRDECFSCYSRCTKPAVVDLGGVHSGGSRVSSLPYQMASVQIFENENTSTMTALCMCGVKTPDVCKILYLVCRYMRIVTIFLGEK